MLGSMRARIPGYMSAGLMLLAVSMAVDAAPNTTPPLTWADISLAIWVRYGAAVATSIAATWVLLAGYERRQDARHADTMKALAAAAAGLHAHNDDRGAHLTASEFNHAPINAQANRIEGRVDKIGLELHDLMRDHNRIQETESTMCSTLSDVCRAMRAEKPWDGINRRAGE